MSNKLIGYDNALWRVEHEFTYTGEDQPFTLQPGEYLFICEGAHGGKGVRNQREYGAITFGEIILNETTTFHAVVGQDGGDCSINDKRAGYGGFNGGGHGGLRTETSSEYYHGAGGGGATDIRLLPYDENEYETYSEWGGYSEDPTNAKLTMEDFCEPDETVYPDLPTEDGYTRLHAFRFQSGGCFNLDYTISQIITELTIHMDAMWFDYSEHHLFDYVGGSYAGRFSFEIKNGHLWGYYTATTSTPAYTQISSIPLMPYQRHHLVFHIKSPSIEVYDNGTLVGTLASSGPMVNPNIKLWIGRYNTNGSSTSYIGLIYQFKILEDDNVVANLYPCSYAYMDEDIHKTDYGLYDVTREIMVNNTNYYQPYVSSDEYLPLEYAQLYCTSTSTNYHSSELNTHYVPKSNTKVTMDVVCFWEGINASNSNSQKQYLFGSGTTNGETSGSNQFSFGIRYNNSNSDYLYAYYARDGQLVKSSDFKYHERLRIECFEKDAKIYQGDTLIQTISVPDATLNTGLPPIHIGSIAYGSSVYSFSKLASCVNFQIYEMTISEINNGEETIIKHFIPAMQESNHDTIGLYDTINQVFLQGNTWKSGPLRMQHPTIQKRPSLNSRIMVAAGAGGGIMQTQPNSITKTAQDGISCGGGAYGTRSSQSDHNYTSYPSQTNYNRYLYPTQSSGYMFGYGQTSTNSSTNSLNGSSGAGGGWYGGFAWKPFGSSVLTGEAGGGGSSYVLTSQSYKPSGYIPDSKYYFTHTQMHAGLAMGDLFATDHTNGEFNHGRVYICKKSNIQKDDIIVYPCTGTGVSHELPAGKYRMKVWGGDSGSRIYMSNCSRGGFSQGLLQTNDPHTIYVHVGGSGGPFTGIGNDETTKTVIANTNCPSLMYNGGAAMSSVPSSVVTYTALTMYDMSGGGSDIRMDVDDCNHRVIVAGGAGSEGVLNSLGGSGGGLSGGEAVGSQGTNNGPGTQSDGYAFGYGEAGKFLSNGYGGSGGGGWYGGCGTTPNGSSDNDKSGAGGSGYVLTETSVKPVGYGCDDPEYYMTEDSTMVGGNNLPLWHTKIQIECLEIASKHLCQDAEGYKHLIQDTSTDPPTKRWVLLESQTITPETFSTYGTSFQTDNGLLNEYKVLVYDETESVSKIALNVTPHIQTVQVDLSGYKNVRDVSIDDIYDDTKFEVMYNVIHEWNETTNQYDYKIDWMIDHITNDDEIYKAYFIKLTASTKTNSYEYIKLDENGRRLFKHYYFDKNGNLAYIERTMEYGDPNDPKYINPDHSVKVVQSLLPIFKGYNIPYEYNMDIIDDDVKNVYGTTGTEYDRSLFFAYVADVEIQGGTLVPKIIIKTMNLIDHAIHDVCRIDLSAINISRGDYSSIGQMLMDDRYFYFNFSKSNINNTHQLYSSILKIDRQTFSVSYSNGNLNTEQTIVRGGPQYWLDDHTILWHGNQHFMTYDTITNAWDAVLHEINNTSTTSCHGFSVGKTKILSIGVCGSALKMAFSDKTTLKKITVKEFDTGISTNYYGAVCYDGNGKFYIAYYQHLYEVDEETETVTRIAEILFMQNVNTCTYCNGAIIVTCYGNTKELTIYRLKEQTFSTLFLPWSTNNGLQQYGYCFIPFTYNGMFMYAITSELFVNYTGIAKYKFGPISDSRNIGTNETNESMFTYDNRFITFGSNYMKMHDGDIIYDFEAFNQNHIASSEMIHKSDYRYLHGSTIIMSEEEEGDET